MKPTFSAKNLPAALLAGGLLLAFTLAFPASAQPMYKWTDEKGRINYSSTPPPGSIKATPLELRGVETYQAGPRQSPSSSGGGAAAAPTGGASGGQAKTEEKKGSAATDPACTDPRSNCGRGDAPEFGFQDRTTERVRPQFTVGAPPPPAPVQPIAPSK